MARITLRDTREIESLKKAGALVVETFDVLRPLIQPGADLKELDRIAEEYIRSKGGIPAYKGYKPQFSRTPFPATICASVNNEICHGIPTRRTLREGDIIGIDIGVFLKGWAGDACYTFAVGAIDPAAQRLLDTTKACLLAGLNEVKPGKRLGDIGAAIEELAHSRGCSVVRELGGHAIGRKVHEGDFHVSHWGTRDTGMVLKKGMVFTIEPMINEGRAETAMLPDGWTVVTADGKRSAQYEHTLAVTETGFEILTPWE
ncbi:MAG: type I methionyl aminopeptidase [Deinococcaceae bacterium]